MGLSTNKFIFIVIKILRLKIQNNPKNIQQISSDKIDNFK
ncbi:hypothetical protein BV121_1397 [Haemophilus influenzae]|nr:hypothetical protein BV121_1397 [Haemophilus influenzae]AVJ01838.1 hypothetical protein BV122_1403 [Haemophilus influenzae]